MPPRPFAAIYGKATSLSPKLGLRSPHVVRASFNRPNLFYKVVPKQKPGDQILRFVRAHASEPGIIYRTTRKSVEQTADMLTRNGIKALTGVGQARLERYGQQFFEVIRAFWENHLPAEDDDLAESQDEAAVPTSPQPAHIPTYVEEARQKHARAYAKWSDEEDQSLRQAWDGLADSPESDAAKIRTIADDFDRKPGAIRSRLKKLGIIEEPATDAT